MIDGSHQLGSQRSIKVGYVVCIYGGMDGWMDGITAPLARFKKRAPSMKQSLEPTHPC